MRRRRQRCRRACGRRGAHADGQATGSYNGLSAEPALSSLQAGLAGAQRQLLPRCVGVPAARLRERLPVVSQKWPTVCCPQGGPCATSVAGTILDYTLSRRSARCELATSSRARVCGDTRFSVRGGLVDSVGAGAMKDGRCLCPPRRPGRCDGQGSWNSHVSALQDVFLLVAVAVTQHCFCGGRPSLGRLKQNGGVGGCCGLLLQGQAGGTG